MKISAVEENDEDSFKNDGDMLGVSADSLMSASSTYPSSSDYSVSLISTIVNSYGSSGGTISMNIKTSSSSTTTYTFYFYLKIYDSNGNEKLSKLVSGTNRWGATATYDISAKQFSPGYYKMKAINYYDNKVMGSGSITVKSPSGSTYPTYVDYSVYVDDTNINYESGGDISMRVSAASNTDYKYYYYLKVYDSNNKEVISKLYSGTSTSISYDYKIGAKQLSAGTYTIKILNYYDNKIMKTKKLTVSLKNSANQNTPTTTTKKVAKTTISFKTVKVKKSAKKLILQATLKQGNKALSGKKVTFKFNGKTYKAKTNKNGIAKVTVKKSVLKKLKVGKKVKYQASYGKVIAKKTAKVKK